MKDQASINATRDQAQTPTLMGFKMIFKVFILTKFFGQIIDSELRGLK